MLDRNQPEPIQQIPSTYYQTLSPWTICLLLGAFLPIPRVPTTLVPCEGRPVVVKSSSPVISKALPPELKLGPDTLAGVGRAPKTENSLAVRVMDRLQQAEAHEGHAHYRQDYRQAWICASFAQKGEAQPFLKSSYAVYGVHPDKVWPRWLEEQKARLGQEYFDWFDSAGNRRPDLPQSSYSSSARGSGVRASRGGGHSRSSHPSAPVFSVNKKEATA